MAKNKNNKVKRNGSSTKAQQIIALLLVGVTLFGFVAMAFGAMI